MFLHKLAQRYNERSEETSIHTEILEELSLWLKYGTLWYVRLGAADLAMRKSKFVLVSMDDVISMTSLVPRPSRGGGERRPGIHCMRMH